MVRWHHGHSALAVGALGEAGRPCAPAPHASGALWRLFGAAQSSAGGDHPHAPPAGDGGRGGDRHGIAALELGAAAEARLGAGYGALPVLPAGDAAHHRRHHAGRGHPEDPPASATVCRPTSYCRSPCPPGSLRLVLRLTAPGGLGYRRPSPAGWRMGATEPLSAPGPAMLPLPVRG